MEDMVVKWLPAVIAAGSAVWMVATMRAYQLVSDKRHDSHDRRLEEHDARLRMTEQGIVGLRVFDELQARRETTA